MRRCSPSRFLAPLALALAVIAVVVVTQSQNSTPRGPATSTPTPTSTAKTSAQPIKQKPGQEPSSYVVKAGDTLSAIADQTGVPVATILGLNRVDAKTLRVGQKLKLRS